jgi:tRNA (guanine37-N1)-methyltransferase
LRKRLKENLQHVLQSSSSPNVYNAFDIIGDIAITKLPTSSETNAKATAEAIMHRHKGIKTVFAQDSGVRGSYRLRSLRLLAGEDKTRTVHKESGCTFAVDVKECYFSPRLLHERQRIAQLVQPNEVIVNMFAGVGCFSILIAKHVATAKVFSIDINPVAVQFMVENIRLNRVFGKVIPLLGDSKTLIDTQLQHSADRVLMPLPEKAFEYLPCAVSTLKPSGGWIHLHGFEHATKTEDPVEKLKLKVSETFASLNVKFEISFSRVARKVGPNWHQVVADLHVFG